MESANIEDNEIISRLKFIGKIQKDEKINVKYLYVQPDNILTRISRTIVAPDNRNNTCNFITSTIKRSFDILNLHLNNNRPFDKVYCYNLITDLRKAEEGLQNLIKTYKEDKMFACKIETIIEEIRARLEDIKEFKILEEYEN
jgi:hypothetical protein